MSEGGTEEQPTGQMLVPTLLLEAAYRMEDSAPVLVLAWPADHALQAARIALLSSVADDLAALAGAVSVLHRGLGRSGTDPS